MGSKKKNAETKACAQTAEREAASSVELKLDDATTEAAESIPSTSASASAQNSEPARPEGSAETPQADTMQSAELNEAPSADSNDGQSNDASQTPVASDAPEIAPSQPNTSLHASAIPLSLKPDASIDWPRTRKRQIFNILYFSFIGLQLKNMAESGNATILSAVGFLFCSILGAGALYYFFFHRHHQTSSDEFSPQVRRSIRAMGLLLPALLMVGYKNTSDNYNSITPSSAAPIAGNFDVELKAGIRDYRQHRFDDALRHFGTASAIDPTSDKAPEWMADTFDYKREYESALSFANHAIELNPQNENAHGIAAHALAMLGQYSASIDEADKALALNPNDGEAYGTKSLALTGQGRFEEALAMDNEHVKYHNQESKAFRQRARTLEALGRSDEARFDRQLAEQIMKAGEHFE